MNFLNTSQVKVFIKLNILFFINVLNTTNSFSQLKKYQFIEQKMGSPFGLQFYHDDSLEAQIIAKKAFQIVDTLNLAFSDYLENSEINFATKMAINGQKVKVSRNLLLVLIESQRAYNLSNGVFDITVGNLTKAWRKVKKNQGPISKSDLKLAKTNAGMKYLEIDSLNSEVGIYKKNISFDLGGIAKGYAAQKVLNFLTINGIESALVDAAGNMAASKNPPENKHWKIAIELPSNSKNIEYQLLNINNFAISTSGDAFQYIIINGKRYSHILNPKTGLGIRNGRQVTIICNDAMKADWLSTALCILPLKKGLLLAKKENAQAFIFTKKKNKNIIKITEGFKQYYSEIK